jgi:hypothetical protein
VRRDTAGRKNVLVRWAVGQGSIFIELWRNMCLITTIRKGKGVPEKLTFTIGQAGQEGWWVFRRVEIPLRMAKGISHTWFKACSLWVGSSTAIKNLFRFCWCRL